MLNGGSTVPEVALAYGRTERCIRDLRNKYHNTGKTEDKPRSGRPWRLFLHQKKITYRKARAALKVEYSELAKLGSFVTQDGTPLEPPSRSTLYRCLKGRGLTNSLCKKRLKLNRGQALKRY
jgi:transposase